MTCESYVNAPDVAATWFVDPPYQNPCGSNYKHHDINYKHLAEWCKTRRGQVIVCEQEGATWLPFSKFTKIQKIGSRSLVSGTTTEVVWYNNAGA